MFGQPKDQPQDQPADQPVDQPGDSVQPDSDPAVTAELNVPTDQPANDQPADMPQDPPVDTSQPSDDSWQHPGLPLNDDQPADDQASAPQPISDIYAPGDSNPNPAQTFHSAPPMVDSNDSAPANPTPLSNDLATIKQEALEKLAPMVDNLQQSPEDHFKTIMMMLQANDDQSLIPKAYEAANSIEDEQVKAQALLDVVNEINYFTQPHDEQQA